MRSVNIEYLGNNTCPSFILNDAKTGDPIPFVESLTIYATVNGYQCVLSKFVRDEGKTAILTATLGNNDDVEPLIDIEHVKINKITTPGMDME